MSRTAAQRQHHDAILQRLPRIPPWLPNRPLRRLPCGVRRVALLGTDPAPIAVEAALIRLPLPQRMAASPPLWAREVILGEPMSTRGGRVRLAYTVDAEGALIRQWYLLPWDYGGTAYGDCRGPDCPINGAWLATIRAGHESEPAWLHLRPEAQSQPHDIAER